MINFCEIINTGTKIRIVTKQSDNDHFDEPIEFEITEEINTFEELITIIQNYIKNESLDRSC